MIEMAHVAFIGNPNCGKTTLFNAYTGANLKVSNWPGVTVEKKEGKYKLGNCKFEIIDLPGIYSLTSYSIEEELTKDYLLTTNLDAIINVVDASNLERNLYLTLQLIEMGKPVIVALNMMDIVEERGMKLDLQRLEERLGVPVIPISATKKIGLTLLLQSVLGYKNKKDKENQYDHQKHRRIISKVNDTYKKLNNSPDKNYEEMLVKESYDYIERIMEEVVINKSKQMELTDHIDRLLTHPYLGLPLFLGIMAFVFYFTFTFGDFIKVIFEVGFDYFTQIVLKSLELLGTGDMIKSLIVEGIMAGVLGVLIFLPNIFILFLALAYLEDSGYMARVAYVMDGIMAKLGLSGRAFIPMLLGFGCTVPAIMASRTLENMVDRRRTILITPFMSCSARLPIYVLFSTMFFGKHGMLISYMMYLIGIVVAIGIAYLMTKLTGKSSDHSLLIELPEYKAPNERTILIYVWEKIKDYVTKAGTTILFASVLIWFILNYGKHGMVSDISDSYAAILGRAITPILSTAGLGIWQVAVALISGLAAKEVVVSSFSVLYGVNNITSTSGMAGLTALLSEQGFGVVNGLSLMVFCLLYTPCVATIGVIHRELRSIKWTIFSVVYQLIIAWLVATIIYQIGIRLVR